jgi:glucosylceramidase
MSKLRLSLYLLGCVWVFCAACRSTPTANVQWWVTQPQNEQKRLQRQASLTLSADKQQNATTLHLDPSQRFQRMEGWGFTLSGGSAEHLHHMSPSARKKVLQHLFSYENEGLGISLLRIPLGASDLDRHPFSYWEQPQKSTDSLLLPIDLREHLQHLIPILKEILAIQPGLRIMASPWSAPAWMKNTGDTRGGTLMPAYMPLYAQSFVQYIAEMKKHNIDIHSITIQNEPLHDGNNPSMYMSAEDMKVFIKNHLGPAFAASSIATKILIYDHNADHPEYPLAILNDPVAKSFVAGSAFHLYAGRIEALSEVHRQHPDREIHFTEQWTEGPGDFARDFTFHMKYIVIGATQNWSRSVFQWNLTNNPTYTPHTDRGGCQRCMGALTIDGDQVTYNSPYYVMAHAAKWVKPGSIRVGSKLSADLPHVAFANSDGQIVLIVYNESQQKQSIQIPYANQYFHFPLEAGEVATLLLSSPNPE